MKQLQQVLVRHSVSNWAGFAPALTLIWSWLALIALTGVEALALPLLASYDLLVIRAVVVVCSVAVVLVVVFPFRAEKPLNLISLEVFIPLSIIEHFRVIVQLVGEVEFVLITCEDDTRDSVSLGVSGQPLTLVFPVDSASREGRDLCDLVVGVFCGKMLVVKRIFPGINGVEAVQ